MRLMLIAPGLYPNQRGGVEKQTDDLASSLATSHDVLVFVTLPGAYEPAADLAYRVEFPAGVAATGARVNRAVEAAARRFRPDVIHFMHVIGLNVVGLGPMLRRLGIPYVVTVNDYWYLCRSVHLIGTNGEPCRNLVQCPGCRVTARRRLLTGAPQPIQTAAIGRLCSRFCSVASAMSAFFWLYYLRRHVLRHFLNAAAALSMVSYRVEAIHRDYRVRLDRAVVQYPGIAQRRPDMGATPEKQRPSSGGHGDGSNLLYLGRVSPEKGVDLLISALRRLGVTRSGTLTIAGACPRATAEVLRVKSAALTGWRVEFGGPYTSEALPGLIGPADAVVIPSIWEEAYGLTVEEARQNGKITVAADTGGIAERFHDGIDGFLFRRGDAGSLATVIDTVLALSPKRAATIAARGARSVTALEHQARRVAQLLEGVASGDRFASVHQRFERVIPAICTITGQEEVQVLERLRAELRAPGSAVRDAWNAAKPQTAQEIEHFYATTDSYLFDLLVAHESWERKMWTKRAIELFARSGARNVLDYGGGCGDDTLEFSSYVDQVTLVEPGEKKSDLATLRLEAVDNARVVRSVGILDTDRFDGVYCTEVLEHVPDPVGLMRILSERLLDHGIIVVTHSFGLISEDFPSHLPSNKGREQTFRRDVRDLGLVIESEVPVPGNRFFVLRRGHA